MRPYGTTLEEAKIYFESLTYPTVGSATPFNRGGYPVRGGDRVMKFTPDELRKAESETQGWIQFETGEYIYKEKLRDQVLDIVSAQGKNKGCVFIGPFDAAMREGGSSDLANSINELLHEGASRGIIMGRVVGPTPGYGGTTEENLKDFENNIYNAIKFGCRLVTVHLVTSDLTYYGAQPIAQIFFNAMKRAGF